MADLVISAQNPLFTNINTDKFVSLLDITVTGATTLEAAAGSNYTIDIPSGVVDGFTVIPNTDVVGKLMIPVRTSDGVVTYGPWFNLFVNVLEVVPSGSGSVMDKSLINNPYLITRDNIISKNPESMRRGDPFYS
jgi:hypothetical protein